MRMKRRLVIPLFLVVLALAIGFVSFSSSSKEEIPYAEFKTLVEEGKVAEAVFTRSGISYTLKGGQKRFLTADPRSPSLREELLLEGVQVGDESLEGTLTTVMDWCFNIFFIVLVVLFIGKGRSLFGSFKTARHTGVRFSDIVGMEREKRDMMLLVDILKHPAKAKELGVRPIKGVILEGPPGNGKTLFAKALAEEAGLTFIATKGADFQSTFMAVGPARVRSLFRKARRSKPCLVFIDEFDGIGEKRNYAGQGIDKENNRMLITLLNEMDGFQPLDGVLVVAATNSYQSLDPALVRPGRFDLHYTIDNPDRKDCEALVAHYGKDKKLGLSASEIAGMCVGLSAAAIESMLNQAVLIQKRDRKETIDRDVIREALSMVS